MESSQVRYMRVEFRRLLKRFADLHVFADWLGCTHANARMMASRGYLSKKYALAAQEKTDGKFKATRLMKESEL